MKTQRDVKLVILSLAAIVIGVIVFSAGGGSLEPTASPRPTGHSLEEIYKVVHSQQASLPTPGFNAFLRIDGIPGESTDVAHQGWIEVQSFQWGVGRGISGAPIHPQLDDIVIVCTLDKASPKLFEACCIGTQIPTATLDLCRPGGITLEYKMSNVIVSSYRASGDTKVDVVPTEQITLNFRQIEATYIMADGNSVKTCWNIDSSSSVCTSTTP